MWVFHEIITQTEHRWLYRWCVRRIQGERECKEFKRSWVQQIEKKYKIVYDKYQNCIQTLNYVFAKSGLKTISTLNNMLRFPGLRFFRPCLKRAPSACTTYLHILFEGHQHLSWCTIFITCYKLLTDFLYRIY